MKPAALTSAPCASAAPDTIQPGRGKLRARQNGDNTRTRLRDTAARLFAEHGYAATESKAICLAAGTDLAAINYHFGSRDELYRTLLLEGHERFVSLPFLQDLIDAQLPPAAKLEAVIDAMVASLHDGQNWHARVVAREVLAPSPHFAHLIQANIWPKFHLMAKIVADVIGVNPQDAAHRTLLLHAVMHVVAPCLMLLLTSRDSGTPSDALLRQDARQLAAWLKRFALGGLLGYKSPSTQRHD